MAVDSVRSEGETSPPATACIACLVQVNMVWCIGFQIKLQPMTFNLNCRPGYGHVAFDFFRCRTRSSVCIACLVQVNMARPIRFQIKLHLMSFNLNSRSGHWHVTVGSIRKSHKLAPYSGSWFQINKKKSVKLWTWISPNPRTQVSRSASKYFWKEKVPYLFTWDYM